MIHNKPAKVSSPTLSAAYRALNNAVVNNHLISLVDKKTLPALGQVNSSLFHATHSPSSWALEHAPAQIDWSGKNIVMQLLPLELHGRFYAYQCIDKRKVGQRRILREPHGGEWTLIYGSGYCSLKHSALNSTLDEASRMHLFGYNNATLQSADGDVIQELCAANRDHAFAFLRHRFERLRHGERIAVFSPAAKKIHMCWLGVLVTVSVCLYREELQETACGQPINLDPSKKYFLSVAAVLACLAGTCVLMCEGGEAALRNALWGPIDHHRLNAMATRHFATNEAESL